MNAADDARQVKELQNEQLRQVVTQLQQVQQDKDMLTQKLDITVKALQEREGQLQQLGAQLQQVEHNKATLTQHLDIASKALQERDTQLRQYYEALQQRDSAIATLQTHYRALLVCVVLLECLKCSSLNIPLERVQNPRIICSNNIV